MPGENRDLRKGDLRGGDKNLDDVGAVTFGKIFAAKSGDQFEIPDAYLQLSVDPVREFSGADLVRFLIDRRILEQVDNSNTYRKKAEGFGDLQSRSRQPAQLQEDVLRLMEESIDATFDIRSREGMRAFVRRKLLQIARRSEQEFGVSGCVDFITEKLVNLVADDLRSGLPKDYRSKAYFAAYFKPLWYDKLKDTEMDQNYVPGEWANELLYAVINHPQNTDKTA